MILSPALEVVDPPLYCSATAITIDLDSFNGESQFIFTGASASYPFTVTSNWAGECGLIETKLSISPASTTVDLISLVTNDLNQQTIKFGASSNKDDAQAYEVTVWVKYTDQSVWTSATATYTYNNPCQTAIITGNSHPDIHTSVLVPASSSIDIWYDSVFQSSSTHWCGPFNFTVSITTTSQTYVASTMESHFSWTTEGTQSTLSVSPTVVNDEVGDYVLHFKVCLQEYDTQCKEFDSKVFITNCVVNTVQIVAQTSMSALSSQTYTLQSATEFQYQLATKQTPACGYASSGWTIQKGAFMTGSKPEKFTASGNIKADTGFYYISVTDGNGVNSAGQYEVVISSVILNQVTYNQTQLEQPNSFILTVQAPPQDCSTSVVTASTTPSTITLKVWDTLAFYPLSGGAAFEEFTDSLSAAASNPSLCPKTYTVQSIVHNTGSGTLTNFAIDSTTRRFQIYSGSIDQVGTYTVTMRGALTTAPTKYLDVVFSVDVTDPCLATTLVAPDALIEMNVFILASNPVTQQVGVVKDSVSVSNGDSTGSQYCGLRQYSISSTLGSATSALSATELYISSTGLISILTSNSATVGTHTVTVVGKLAYYTNIQLTLASIQITVHPCVVTSLQVVQKSNQGNLVAQSYTLSSTATLTYELTTKQTPNCNYASQGWSVSATGPDQTNFQNIVSSSGMYQVGPVQSPASAGTYTIQVESVTVNGVTYGSTSPALLSPSSFTLTVISPCATSLVTASTVSDVAVQVFDSELLFTAQSFSEFTDSVSTSNGITNFCPKTYTASVSQLTSGVSLTSFSLDTVQRKFSIFSQNLNQIGTYTVTLRCEITGYSNQFATTTFTITVNDPCPTTAFVTPYPQPSNMMTSVLVQASIGGSPFYETQQVGVLKDHLSETYGDSTGVQYCGSRSYSISSTQGSALIPLSTTELTIDQSSGLISIYTGNAATIGTHTVTVSVSLASYSTISATLPSFTVEIIGCEVTTFTLTLPSPTYNQTYTIGSGAYSWNLAASSLTNQIPSCGYAVTLSSITSASFVQSTAGQTIHYTVDTRNVADAGLYAIDVIATVNDYTFSPAKTAPTQHSTFVLQVIDPCLATTISTTPSQIENLVTFAGFDTKSLNEYSFNDSISVTRTLSTDFQDFCGEKILRFKLNDTETQFLSAINKGYINFSTNGGIPNFGVAQSKVEAYMKNYESIVSAPITFTVAVLGSVVPIIPAATYFVNSQALVVTVQDFKVLPQNFDAGLSTIDAYVLDSGKTLGQFVDFGCTCLSDITDKPWISFSKTNNELTVYTTESSVIGDYTIVLVQSFVNFPQVHPYSKLKLKITRKEETFLPKSPPIFEPLLPPLIKEQQQCGESNQKLWTFKVPQTEDSSNSPVSLRVDLDAKFFKYDSDAQTISQMSACISSVNKTIKFILQNQLNLTAIYSVNVQFVCDQPVVVKNFTAPKQQVAQSKAFVQRPVLITSISRSGVLQIKFYKPVFVPNFRPTSNSTAKDQTRKLSQKQSEYTLEQYINKDVLSVKLKTRFNTSDVDWACTAFTNSSLQLSINFTDPMEISQSYPDELVVQFLQTDQFLLSSESEFLFGNGSLKTLVFKIPTQLPSKTTAAFFQSVTESVQQVGVTVVVVTLLLQIVAKKVITSMWLYYCALQLELLLVQRSNMFPPSSVDLVISSVSGIINLSSLDKKQIASALHVDVLLNSEVFQSLDGVAVSAIGIILFVLLCATAICITRKFPKVQLMFIKIRNIIFWNFLIRYFQASFIGFNYAALSNVQKISASPQDIGTSSIILIVQYGLVCYIAYFLIKKSLYELSNLVVRQRIGNLYFNLDTKQRYKVLFGFLFFAQRIFVVLIVAVKSNFTVQWQLCQLVILMNTLYVFTASPYSDPSNATLDCVNCLFLLCACILMATYSPWNTETNERFFYGMVFDCLVGLQFFVNLVFVIGQVTTQLILKVKQIRFRFKLQKRRKEKRARDLLKVNSQTSSSALNKTTTTTVCGELLKDPYQSANFQRDDSEMQLKLRKKLRVKAEQEQLRNQEQLEDIVEISYDSESDANNQLQENQPASYESRSKRRSKTQVNKDLEKYLPLVAQKLEQQVKLPQQKPEPIEDNSAQAQLDRYLKFYKQEKVNLRKDLNSRNQDQSQAQTGTQFFAEMTSKTTLNQFVNVKTKSPDLGTVLKRKVVAQVAQDSQPSFVQKMLDSEIAHYYSGMNDGVRLYPLGTFFSPDNDVWLYQRQIADQNYKGTFISADEHREQVKIYLKQKWMEQYPLMPHLPLFVKVEIYHEICRELETEVKNLCEQKRQLKKQQEAQRRYRF